MKKIFYPVLLLVLAACKNPEQTSETIVPAPAIADIPTDTVTTQVDGITSATSKPNQVSFNGTIVLPPQRQATVKPHYGRSSETHLTLTRATSTARCPAGNTRESRLHRTATNLSRQPCPSRISAEYEYERQKTLSTEQAASQKKFQQSKADYLSMKSKLEATAAQLTLLGIVPEELLKSGIQPLLQVKAPISGYISDVAMNIGKYIQPGEALCEVIDKSAPLLCLTTYEKDLADMKVGSPVQFRVNGMGKTVFKATLVSIGQKVDEVSRSLEVYARIDDVNQQFRPGMYVTARIQK